MKAIVNKIIPFSCVDGPGNRTAVFLQGCNIDCKYCHNPETRKLCVHCGACVEKCPAGALSINKEGKVVYDSKVCVQCDTCIHICKNDSSPRTKEMTAEEVYAEVKKQIPFIRGITVSGGECMLQAQFMEKVFYLAKEDGLSTLIDSNGTIPFWEYPALMDVTDGVMLDIKAFDEKDHFHITGYTNKVVLENAKYLSEIGKLHEVRVVVVQDLYDAEQSVKQIGEYLSSYADTNQIRIKLIAYRPMGVREQYAYYGSPSESFMKQLANIFKTYGFENIIII